MGGPILYLVGQSNCAKKEHIRESIFFFPPYLEPCLSIGRWLLRPLPPPTTLERLSETSLLFCLCLFSCVLPPRIGLGPLGTLFPLFEHARN